MVQAFASHQLALDWQSAGTRLARLFTDYEPGIHWPQVQMQAGQTGINTPRIYNPVKQGLDQDPEGTFTRSWVPELADVPLPFLQTPWLLDTEAQPANYPAPIVDLAQSARLARERLTSIRKQPCYGAEAERIYFRHGSRQRPINNDNPTRQRPKRTAQLVLNL
jgi:deoxyribodipyrimidine photo-lyase